MVFTFTLNNCLNDSNIIIRLNNFYNFKILINKLFMLSLRVAHYFFMQNKDQLSKGTT